MDVCDVLSMCKSKIIISLCVVFFTGDLLIYGEILIGSYEQDN